MQLTTRLGLRLRLGLGLRLRLWLRLCAHRDESDEDKRDDKGKNAAAICRRRYGREEQLPRQAEDVQQVVRGCGRRVGVVVAAVHYESLFELRGPGGSRKLVKGARGVGGHLRQRTRDWGWGERLATWRPV